LLHLREAATPTTKLLLGDFILPLACLDEAGGNEMLQDVQGVEAMLAPPPLLPNLGKASANAYWMDLTVRPSITPHASDTEPVVYISRCRSCSMLRNGHYEKS
jgi:hypothetical protein